MFTANSLPIGSLSMMQHRSLKMLQHGRIGAYYMVWRHSFAQRRFFNIETNLLDDLASRNLIADVTRPDKLKLALSGQERQAVYAGVDPTADSLHVGHLLPMMCLLHFQIRGQCIIPLIGGATGLVGDPSGRSLERQLADVGKIEHNVIKLQVNIEKFFKRAQVYALERLPNSEKVTHEPIVLNNLEWLKDLNMVEFLRTVGVTVRVNAMLNRQSVQSRMDSQQGISFTEFTYQLLQAYDFYYLHKSHNCTIQIGGSDQWGNILAGLEMINRLEDLGPGTKLVRPQRGFGITTPLLTTSSGEKFGKSAGNAIWLDEQKTSIFDFYQFFLKTTDADVEKYLKMFTLLPIFDINEIILQHNNKPDLRKAQRLLADEITQLVHMEDGLRQAHVATKVLFETNYFAIQANDVVHAFKGDPRLVFCEKGELFSTSLPRLAAMFKLVPSSNAARNLIQSGGLHINNRPVDNVHSTITATDLIDERLVILRAGRSKCLFLILQ